MTDSFLCRSYPEEGPLTEEELADFKRMLKDNPRLAKAFKDFRTLEHQELRSRIGRSPWLSMELDMAFELAALNYEEEDRERHLIGRLKGEA